MPDSKNTLRKVKELSSDKELRAGIWIRYGKYGIATAGDGTRCIRAISRGGKGKEYQPLVKHPLLFLRFARIADDGGLDADPLDTDKNRAAAIRWAESYGVLGLTPPKKPGAWWDDPRGGPEDTVAAFASEALLANTVLRLYEAATNPQGVDVETIGRFAAKLAPIRYRETIASNAAGIAREWAIGWAVAKVQAQLGRHSYPQIYWRQADERRIAGYDFGSLLGAMYLQAMWLLIADRPGRCRRPECPRIIAFEQPEQKPDPNVVNDRGMGYKKRADAEYCSTKCSNAHYYERETKPRRARLAARRKAAKN